MSEAMLSSPRGDVSVSFLLARLGASFAAVPRATAHSANRSHVSGVFHASDSNANSASTCRPSVSAANAAAASASSRASSSRASFVVASSSRASFVHVDSKTTVAAA